MEEKEKPIRKKEIEEMLPRVARQVGILGKVLLSLNLEDPNRRSLVSALKISCSIVNFLDAKTALEGIVEGFAMARGDFRTLMTLFEILRGCGLPKTIRPTFHLKGISESPRKELGFVFRADKLKLVAKDKNAKIVVNKMIQIVKTRAERRRISRVR